MYHIELGASYILKIVSVSLLGSHLVYRSPLKAFKLSVVKKSMISTGRKAF